MASLIEGFEYDIFISYRQKDNKHDGWVTEFINQLKGELEATFKEDISIYFDENPHDGLLETHSVDKSLEGKLKCLIFIPIISQTYCDPKSFAWQHEFCAFNKLAKEDKLGRDIKLASGNVAIRILPIKIHDLDPEDKTLLENELGGVLRSIEFIYKSAGVNRPLRATEDHPQDNLNKTYYRDQINKVANAAKEIITALKNQSQHPEEVSKQDFTIKPVPQKNLRTKIIIASVSILALIILGYFIVPKLFKPSEELEKSIAVLPFKSLSDDPEKQYLADGIMDAIVTHLQKFRDLRVIDRTSVQQYRETTKTTQVIGKELEVEYLIEGSFQKYEDNIRLSVRLIKANEKSSAWANDYNRNWKDIFSVQSEVAQTIAKELYAIITPEEKQQIEKIPTTNLTAYDLYLKANDYQKDYQKTRDLGSYQKSVAFYQAALDIDSAFAKAYAGLARAYFSRNFYETFFNKNFLDSCLLLANIALSIDDKLDEAYYLRGLYYMANVNTEKALYNYDLALKINPNYYLAYYYKGFLLTRSDLVNGIDNYLKALNLIHGDERPLLLRNLGNAYSLVGFIDKAKYYYNEALAMDKDSAAYLSRLAFLEFSTENYEKALELANKAYEIDSTLLDIFFYSVPPGHNEEAYVQANRWIEYSKKTGVLLLNQSHRVGYVFWQVGKFKEAESYFKQQIKYSEESIKLGRENYQLLMTAQSCLAQTYAFMGNKVKTYQYLDELNAINFSPLWRISLYKSDPLFESIRNEERFQKILQKEISKNQAEHERVRKWLEDQGML